MLKALLVRGPFRGMSGYDRHTRLFTRELVRHIPEVQLLDVRDWNSPLLPAHQYDPWFERLTRRVRSKITLHFTMPHQVVAVGDAVDVNYTMFEADGVQPFWIEHSLRHRMVIVPTESSRVAWVQSGYPEERIAICPLGVDVDLFATPAEPLAMTLESGRPIADFGTRFLNVSELGPRKNLEGLLAAWMLATNPDDDAVLMIKLSRYRPEMFEVLRRRIEETEQRIGRKIEDAAPIEVLFGILPDEEMPRLYAAATHYISLSHGEGWDQPMVEAAVNGLQLIAPDHSAYQSYLTADTATLIPSPLGPVLDEDTYVKALFGGLNWWEPDQEVAAGYIRAAIDQKLPRRPGAREHIIERYSWEQSGRRLAEILSEIDAELPG